ncbi:MAG: DnaA regulatory inactivator Hda [Pseudomonadota bacterium]|nr:MAG: DnaA regulatory inactivator Hda [Pseudomonadota bacterium]
MSGQITLAIDGTYSATLENFVVGENAELLNSLRAQRSGFRGVWISGLASSGRSHLLAAYRAHVAQQARAAISSPAALLTAPSRKFGVTQQQQGAQGGSESGAAVIIDDIGVLQNLGIAEEGLMSIYQSRTQQVVLLISHTTSALGVEFALADLNSRMRGLEHFALVPLNDADKAQVLTARAQAKGYELTEAVLDYWLRRGPETWQRWLPICSDLTRQL